MVSQTLVELPDDVEALKAIIAKQAEQIAALEHNVEVFRRLVFGPSSEKRRGGEETPAHPMQGHLFFAPLLAEAERVSRETGAEGSLEIAPPSSAPRKRGRRNKFPEHMPRATSTFELPAEQQRCKCGGELHEIGHETTRELQRIETTVVHEIRRVKYGCRNCCEGVTVAPGPERVIEKGILAPSFLAHVWSERFGNHMPYYRLEKKYASEGLDLSRSVLERSMAKCAELLEPVYEELKRQVVASEVLFTDDTPVTVARPSSGNGSRPGRVWVYTTGELVVYDFTETRKRDGPLSFLEGFEGFAHADAYPGLDALFLPGDVIEVACWAHARRKFVESESTDPELSKEAVDRIRRLYAVERAAKGKEPEERRALRQEHAVPLLEELRAWLAVAEVKVLPKSPMGSAIHYAQAQWRALTRYVEDGRLEIDNNTAERALRPFAVGRKNWLFFQTLGGGRSGVILMSLLMTAKEAGINVQVYFRDLLLRLAHESDVTKLVPHGWRKHFAEQVEAEHQAAIAKLFGR